MKVMKFGGTSVGTPQRMKEVAQLVAKSGEQVFVVLSAMSGTTNSLVEISDYLYKKNPDGANEVINRLEQKYDKHVDELYSKDETKAQTREFLKSEFDYLRSFTKELFTSFEEKSIVAQGEMMSTNMVVNYMNEIGIKAVLLNALDLILMAVMLSLAAMALILPYSVLLLMVVPSASGSMVLSRRTGIPAYLAGCTQVGCRILAPK